MTTKNYFIRILAVVQAAFMIWFVVNGFAGITMYADTTELLDIAETLKADEYKGILYPLLIRGAMFLEGVLVIKYYQIIYIIQFAVCVMAIGFLLGSCADWKERLADYYFSISYLTSVPMLAAMYVRVHPAALQVALWFYLIGCAVRIRKSSQKSCPNIGMVVASAVLVLLVPNDRFVLLIFWAVLCAVEVIKKREYKRLLILSFSSLVWMAVAISFLQSGEGRGRMEQSLSAAWFLECTSPHFAKDYVCWPEEVRAEISLEEAVLMVRRDEGLLKGIDERLVNAYGRKMTNAFYKRMGNTAFSMHTKETVYSYRDDVLQGIFTPFSIMNHKNSGYNSKEGYWYSDFPKMLGDAGKYVYFGSIIVLGVLVLWKAIEKIIAFSKKRFRVTTSGTLALLALVGVLQVLISAFLDVGAMDYTNYPVMIFLWYLMVIVI